MDHGQAPSARAEGPRSCAGRWRRVAPLALLLTLAVAATSAAADALVEQARALFGVHAQPVTSGAPAEQLGRELFFDTRLGKDGRTGCVSCHLPEHWGADGRTRSPDARGRLTERNSPTVFDAAALPGLRWRADRKSAAHQAEDSIKGSMGYEAAADIVPALRRLGYEEAFAQAYPATTDPVTSTNFAAALEAFQRTLVTRAPFDRFVAGDPAALTPRQRAGLQSFIGRGCAGCHDGTTLGGTALRRFGVVRDYWSLTGSSDIDVGRYALTRDEADRHVFRVPLLRNVARTAPYFHDGSVGSLRDAVRIMGEAQLGIELPGAELDAIVDFLDALTGEVPPQFAPPAGATAGAKAGGAPLTSRP